MNKFLSFLVFCLSLITTARAQTTIIEKDLDTVVLSSPDCIVAVRKYVPPTINRRPIARAGEDFSITLPLTQFQLDGTPSVDPDGFIKSYGWRKISGPAVTIPIANKAIISVTNASTVGIYAFELRVVDNLGLMAADTVKVAVNNVIPVNQPPIANAGPDISITLPQSSVQLDGSRSSDVDGIVQSFAWRRISGPTVTISNADKSIATVSNLRQATYAFELKVSDNNGAVRSDTVRVVVNPAVVVNQPPNAVAVAAPSSITLPTTTVNLSAASSTDADGAILSWLWEKVAGPPAGTIVNVSASESVVNGLTVAGTYTYKLTVTDDQGAKSSANVSVIVNPEIVNPPTGDTFPFSFTAIPFSDPDLVRPGAGAEQWHDRTDVNIPVEGTNTIPRDVYYRTTWNRFEGATKDSWNFSWLDARINEAIGRKQKLNFGIMTVYTEVDANTGGVSYDGGTSAYPLYLHQMMQAENPKDWKVGGNSWIPNWNSPSYHTRLLALNTAINNHLLNTRSASGIRYFDVIGMIDIRGYGNWGEWHSAFFDGFQTSQYPSGTFPTAASLIKIVDAFRIGFPDIQLQAMVSGFDANWLDNTNNPPEIANYLLTAKNNVGLFGWRRDNWGALDGYLKDYIENNNRSFGNSGPFKTLIMDRYKFAPVTGEPPGWNPSDYSDLERQVKLQHATSFGNGNYGGGQPPSAAGKPRVRAASKAAGYRLEVKSGEIKTGNGSMSVTVNWNNSGQTPTYENWIVVYDIINSSGTVVKSVQSQFKPRLFMGTVTVTDVFSASGLSGTYKVNLRVTESYRGNMPLFVTARNSDNSITLKSGVTISNQ